MSTITTDQKSEISSKIAGMTLKRGLGDGHNACSIAAINLALSGELTDTIPNCMSLEVGRWIIKIQDSIPDEVRNSARWRKLLPLAAGTGRLLERERAEVALDWMWGVVLPKLQETADAFGYGVKWRAMIESRSSTAASDAAASIRNHYASEAASAAASSVATACLPYSAEYAISYFVAFAASYSAYLEGNGRKFWLDIDPCDCLEKMIMVGEG